MTIYANGELHLYGTVGADPFGFDEEHFTSQQVRDALSQHGGGPLTVLLNSGGGYLWEGLAIHNALKGHAAAVTVVVDGIAASAASLLAMAGDRIVMRLGSTMMIHSPSSQTSGTAADHERAQRALAAQEEEMALIYAARSGKTIEAVRKLMIAETWFTGAESVAQGFAELVDDMAARSVARFDYGKAYRHPPEDVRKHSAKAILAHSIAVTNWKSGGSSGRKPRKDGCHPLAQITKAANARRGKRF